MSWVDEKTDVENILDVFSSIQSAMLIKTTAVIAADTLGDTSAIIAAQSAAEVAFQTYLNTEMIQKISTLQTKENIRRIKLKKIISDSQNFLARIAKIS